MLSKFYAKSYTQNTLTKYTVEYTNDKFAQHVFISKKNLEKWQSFGIPHLDDVTSLTEVLVVVVVPVTDPLADSFAKYINAFCSCL